MRETVELLDEVGCGGVLESGGVSSGIKSTTCAGIFCPAFEISS